MTTIVDDCETGSGNNMCKAPGTFEAEAHREHDAEVEIEYSGTPEVEPSDDEPIKFKFNFRRLWKFCGPGWLMSLAYLDPGNLESDLQQGAYTNLTLIWVLWWATVMGLFLQEMSARIGIVTGKDLAQCVRTEYPRWLNYIIYFMMELAVIGSDIQEVVGTGIALYLLSNGAIPVWAGCLITGMDSFTFLAVQYLGVRYLEAFIFLLIATMTGCFFVNWGNTQGNPDALFLGWVVPTSQSWAVQQAVGTIGAVIMPHNLYLHSGLVLSRKIDRKSVTKMNDAIWYGRIEAAIALLVSFFINLAIVAVNAELFFNSECAQSADGPLACMDKRAYVDAGFGSVGNGSQTCVLPRPSVDGSPGMTGVCADFGLQSTAFALKYALGGYALYMWAVGVFAAGQSATMVCTYAGQIIMGGCLQLSMKPWMRVCITRAVALGPAIAVACGTYNNQVLFNNINQYLNILQSVQLPFAMLPVLHFAAQKKLMGRFTSGAGWSIATNLMALSVIGVSVYLIYLFIADWDKWPTVLVCLYGVFYFFLCYKMVEVDLVWAVNFVRGCSE